MPPFNEDQEFDTIGTAQTELENITYMPIFQSLRYVFVKPNGKYVGLTSMSGFPYNHPIGWKLVCEIAIHPNVNSKWRLNLLYTGDTGDFHELPIVGL